MLGIIWVMVFAAVSIFTYGVVTLWGKRSRVKDLLDNPRPGSVGATLLRQEAEEHPIRFWLFKWVSMPGQWSMSDLDKVSEARLRLIRSGYRHPQAPALYFGLRVICAFLLPLGTLLVMLVGKKIGPLHLVMLFLSSVVGFLIPTKLLDLKIKRRQEQLDRALPDVLDLLVICMEAGLALNAALNRVADEIRGVYKFFYEELQIVAAELRTGIPWDESFDNLAKRTDVQSVRSVVGLMIQSDRLGASIGQALRNHGDFIRVQRVLRAEEKAAKLPVKMLFPLILCIFPAIVIVVVGPGIIHIIDKLFGVFFKQVPTMRF